MRNCFVPGCDAHCKKINATQRKMFLAPQKMLDVWKEILPQKRILKKHDRICERHFDETDIVQYWESTINGQIHLTPRDKPKLRDNAVPCKNLPNKNEFQVIAPAKRKLQDAEDEPPKSNKTRTKESKQAIAVITTPVLEHNENRPDSQEDTAEQKVEEEPSPQKTVTDLREMSAAFENLYDEAFDVTVPSLLWGIHRDPDRKFIAFSKFDNLTMSFSMLLHIDDTFHCKTFIEQELQLARDLQIEQLNSDYVSSMLDDLEGTKSKS